jgi:microcystin degradation protein MlrC
VSVTIGGVLDPINGSPLNVTGTVHAIHTNDPVGGDIVVIRSGGVHIIVTSRRKPYHQIDDFRNLDLDLGEHEITVVKIGYLEPELREAASSSFLALTPGAVNQDIASLPFARVERPVFPLDPEMADPAFNVRIFGPIG